jgi:hypothetical protein
MRAEIAFPTLPNTNQTRRVKGTEWKKLRPGIYARSALTTLFHYKKGLERENLIMKHEPGLRSWMELWSMGAIYETHSAGGTFFKYYES